MKFINYLILIFLILSSCKGQGTISKNITHIDSVSIDKLRLKMKITEANDLFETSKSKVPFVINDENGDWHSFKNNTIDSLFALVENGEITKIVYTGIKYKSADNLGVGITANYIKEKFPEAIVLLNFNYNTEYIVINGIEFHFFTNDKNRIGEYSDEDPEYGSSIINGNRRVDAIFLRSKQ